ncbi:MAG: hypothetical protein K9L88_10600 [Chromatiaceae bacterium]|nr:hypothetical protein [Chromatiaceae bacterium]
MNASVKMAYGKGTDGAPVHIRDSANGLSCGCQCIECGSPLVAKQGNVLDWHFAHAVESACGGYSPETILHYRAKHLFAEMARHDGLHSLLPAGLFSSEEYRKWDDEDRIIMHSAPDDVVLISCWGVNLYRHLIPNLFCEVKVEGRSPCGAYQPDVAVYPMEHPTDPDIFDSFALPRQAFVGIEIVVTHDVDEAKLEKIRKANDVSMRVLLGGADSGISNERLLSAMKQNLHVLSYGEGFLPRKLGGPYPWLD